MLAVVPVDISKVCTASSQSMFARNHMTPPELSQSLEAQSPILSVSGDMEHNAAIHSPDIQVAPVAVKNVHQALHLHGSVVGFKDYVRDWANT